MGLADKGKFIVTPWLLLLPALIAVGVFYYFPLVQSLIFSFFDLQFTTELSLERFIRLDNYRNALMDSRFLSALGFTLGFSLAVVALDLTLGMLLAQASFLVPRRVQPIMRSLIIIPWAIPPIIQASMWRWLLNSSSGPLADLAVRTGLLNEQPLFLAEPLSAMASVVFAFSWKGASITAFFFIGALAMISREVVDAAHIDGAGRIRRFFSITIPMIMPTIFVALLFRTQDALRVFDLIYGLTGGGPGTTTETLSSFAYTSFFRHANFGLGSAYSMITFALVALFGGFYISKIARRFDYQGG